MTDKRTSAEWYANLSKYYDITILDYDGWDRNNFDYSFNEELITSEEFDRRIAMSTIVPKEKNVFESIAKGDFGKPAIHDKLIGK